MIRAEILPDDDWAGAAARRIAPALKESKTVVVTGGRSAATLYPELAVAESSWERKEILFSDERCVPPDDDRSNYRLVVTGLFASRPPPGLRRMQGEDDPAVAAQQYEAVAAPLVAAGIDVAILGLGDDGHIAALFPRSPQLTASDRLCVAVPRPDGMTGLTLTPPALTAARQIFLLARGGDKKDAVAAALDASTEAADCPARLLATCETLVLADRQAGASLVDRVAGKGE